MKRMLALLLMCCMLISIAPTFAAAEDEWITLRVECFDRSIAGFNVEDCMQLHYIQENFGDPNKIKVEFVPFARWSETELLNVQLAGGTAPDLCFTYDTNLIQQYVEMGGVLPLDDLLAEHGQNLVSFLGESVLEYGQSVTDGADGPVSTQYYVPAKRMHTAKSMLYIRGDWLEALDMQEPTTVEELTAYLYAAKEANLGNQATIPVSMSLYAEDPINNFWLMNAFIDFEQLTEEDWYAYSSMREFLPGVKEAFRLLNQYYNDGLLNEYFGITNSADREKTDIIQGNTGFMMAQYDTVWRADHLYQQELEKNVEGAYWTAIDCFRNADGHTWKELYSPIGLGIFIPSWVNEDVAIAAVKYLDWMSEYENMFFLQNGVEGVNYLSKTEDGIPLEIQPIDNVADEYKMHALDICVVVNGLNYGSQELNNKAASLGFPGYEEAATKSFDLAYVDGYEPVGFTSTIQAEVDYGTMVKSKEGELFVNAVTCAPEDFDAVYDQYCQAILDVGGEQIVNEKREAYQAGLIRGAYPYADKAE